MQFESRKRIHEYDYEEFDHLKERVMYWEQTKRFQESRITTTTHQKTVEMMMNASMNLKQLPRVQLDDLSDIDKDLLPCSNKFNQKPFWPQLIKPLRNKD